jgi:hypothetical protein
MMMKAQTSGGNREVSNRGIKGDFNIKVHCQHLSGLLDGTDPTEVHLKY